MISHNEKLSKIIKKKQLHIVFKIVKNVLTTVSRLKRVQWRKTTRRIGTAVGLSKIGISSQSFYTTSITWPYLLLCRDFNKVFIGLQCAHIHIMFVLVYYIQFVIQFWGKGRNGNVLTLGFLSSIEHWGRRGAGRWACDCGLVGSIPTRMNDIFNIFIFATPHAIYLKSSAKSGERKWLNGNGIF